MKKDARVSFLNTGKGFTLVELLVVISIIALLLAVLMPALSKARLGAQNVVCRTNLRQYALGTTMYTQENGIFPMPWNAYYPDSSLSGAHPQACRWHDKEGTKLNSGGIWEYVKQAEIELCPTFASLARQYGKDLHNDSMCVVPLEPQYGYSMNACLGSTRADPPDGIHGTIRGAVDKPAEVRRPSETFLWAEEAVWFVRSDGTYGTEYYRTGFMLNDTALCTTWGLVNGNNGCQRVSEGQVDSINIRDMTKYKLWPDAVAAFHKTSMTKAKRDEGVSNACMADGSVSDVFWKESLIYAWPRKK